MNHEFAAEACTPDGLQAPTPAPQRAGRFAQTRKTRAMRGIFAGLCRYAPNVAAHLAFGLLARPPRPRCATGTSCFARRPCTAA